MKKQIVFLTGASAGIGQATAKMLVDAGAVVYGASRRAAQAYQNQQSGGEFVPVQLDVNDEIQLGSAVQRIVEERGCLNVVVANAGNGLAGSVEDASSEEVKYQFETNFFGVVKTIQACLPVFRSQGYGRVIAVSSVAAVIPIPYQAYYSSVKAALLMLMQALAIELKPFHIQCSTILPGDTKTAFTSARKYSVKAQQPDSPYYQRMKISVGKMEKDEQNGMPPEKISKAIVQQVYRKRMKAVVVPRIDYKLICLLGNWLPSRLKIWMVSKIY